MLKRLYDEESGGAGRLGEKNSPRSSNSFDRSLVAILDGEETVERTVVAIEVQSFRDALGSS